jgi:hypothetical protein
LKKNYIAKSKDVSLAFCTSPRAEKAFWMLCKIVKSEMVGPQLYFSKNKYQITAHCFCS